MSRPHAHGAAAPDARRQARRQRADVAGPEGEQHVAVLQHPFQDRGQLFQRLHEYRVDPPARPDRPAQGAPVGAGDRCLARRVDLAEQQHVDLGEHPGEILEQVAGPGIAVRLKGDHQAALRPAVPDRAHSGGDLPGVMAVVVDEQHPTARAVEFPIDLETPADPLESLKPAQQGPVADAQFVGYGNGGEGVLHVVPSREVQRHLEPLAHPVATHREVGPCALLPEVHGAHAGLLAEPVGQDRTPDLRQQIAHHRVVEAQHRKAVERQVMQKFQEAATQRPEIAPVGTQVIGVDVGDHGHHRLQIQERGVALVGLRDQVAPAAEARVAAGAVQAPADDKGRVAPRLGQQGRDQAGRGGLAVSPGDRDPVTETHQLGEHLGARDHRDAARPRPRDLRVLRPDRGGHHHHIAILDVRRIVADDHAGAERAQALRDRVLPQIGTGDPIAEVDEHLGDPAHAGAADPHQVDAADTAHAGFALDAHP